MIVLLSAELQGKGRAGESETIVTSQTLARRRSNTKQESSQYNCFRTFALSEIYPRGSMHKWVYEAESAIMCGGLRNRGEEERS